MLRSRGSWAVIVATAAASCGALAGAAPAADAGPSARTIAVTLSEWKLVASAKSVPAGRVTFRVANAGHLGHEFVVLRSERHHHTLPTAAGRAKEVGRIGKLPQMRAGATRTLTLKLRPGKYVLLCNLLGHYKAGQYSALRAR
jgi:uncharacterized cupredoxin-like copper-binding protein